MADEDESWFARARRKIQEDEASQPPPPDAPTNFSDRFGAAGGAPAANWFERARAGSAAAPDASGPGPLPPLPPSSLPSWMPSWLKPNPDVQYRLNLQADYERKHPEQPSRWLVGGKILADTVDPYGFAYGAAQGATLPFALAGRALGIPGSGTVADWALAPAESSAQSVGRAAAPGAPVLKGAAIGLRAAGRGYNYLWKNHPYQMTLAHYLAAQHMPHWLGPLLHVFAPEE